LLIKSVDDEILDRAIHIVEEKSRREKAQAAARES
jgi:hypothetical protein